MPTNNTQQHSEVCELLKQIYAGKNADYGNNFSKTFTEFGLISAVIRVSDKCERLKNLTVNESSVKDESVIDTLLDLANYAIMTIMELSNK